jgi:hypothetical protein
MSLKDGGTKRREEIARIASWCRKAASRARGVKNMPIVGTSILSFERRFPAFWCSTWRLYVSIASEIDSTSTMRTVISDESLDIPHDVCIALLSCGSHSGQAPVLNSIVCCSWLGVEDERYGEKRLGREWASASASAALRSTSGNTRARTGVQRLLSPEARRASQRSETKLECSSP